MEFIAKDKKMTSETNYFFLLFTYTKMSYTTTLRKESTYTHSFRAHT